jgi:phosphate transport system substrate-binding protein
MKSIFYFAGVLLTFISLSSCSEPTSSDTHSAGKTVIYVEESFKPLFETSIDTFESLNAKAEITAKYNSESNIIDMFFKNKTKTICISRDFTKEEKTQLKKNQVEVRSDKIAGDAIALIVNPENPDTLMTVDQLKRIITGKDTIWSGLKTKINVVFDQENSANFHYLKELCAIGNLPINVFAVKSNEEVINYVKTHKSALGVIGVNWVSDRDDFDVLDFLNGIKVVAVAKTKNDEYFKPYQGFIYTKEYALTREVWMINKAKKSGLNTGLVLFMTGDGGQLLIQKCGLVPATSPVRLIQMSTEE